MLEVLNQTMEFLSNVKGSIMDATIMYENGLISYL